MKDIENGLHLIHADARNSTVSSSFDQQMEELGCLACVCLYLIIRFDYSLCIHFLQLNSYKLLCGYNIEYNIRKFNILIPSTHIH